MDQFESKNSTCKQLVSETNRHLPGRDALVIDRRRAYTDLFTRGGRLGNYGEIGLCENEMKLLKSSPLYQFISKQNIHPSEAEAQVSKRSVKYTTMEDILRNFPTHEEPKLYFIDYVKLLASAFNSCVISYTTFNRIKLSNNSNIVDVEKWIVKKKKKKMMEEIRYGRVIKIIAIDFECGKNDILFVAQRADVVGALIGGYCPSIYLTTNYNVLSVNTIIKPIVVFHDCQHETGGCDIIEGTESKRLGSAVVNNLLSK